MVSVVYVVGGEVWIVWWYIGVATNWRHGQHGKAVMKPPQVTTRAPAYKMVQWCMVGEVRPMGGMVKKARPNDLPGRQPKRQHIICLQASTTDG